jgi:hypothetical protein
MGLELEYRKRVFALLLMFVPYGLAIPPIAKAVDEGAFEKVVTLDSGYYRDTYMPSVYTGGTLAYGVAVYVDDPSRKIT